MSTHDLDLGSRRISVDLPARTVVRGMGRPPDPVDPSRAIREALTDPTGTPPLRDIAERTLGGRGQGDPEAVIVVSDHTRPVPYRGEEGLLLPLVRTLREAGFEDRWITVLVGAGSHRDMKASEIEEMLGLSEWGLDAVTVRNHEYADSDRLRDLGRTDRGTPIQVSARYLDADLTVVTGLVESHFMAGASGGRKGICPGIVGRQTLTSFHGAELLDSPRARDLSLVGNPLHEEALEVADAAGCDFLLNVTLDAEKRLTGVFAGDVVEAHEAAVRQIESYVAIDLDRTYDVVLVPGHHVSVNHYQAAKAAVEGARAVRPGGTVIVAAAHSEPDPIGGSGYREALRVLAEHGPRGFMDRISDSHWTFVQEQWQVQMWCRVLERVERPENLVHCALRIPREDYAWLPGTPGLDLLDSGEHELEEPRKLSLMVERSVGAALARSPSVRPSVLLLRDGPYAIPRLSRSAGAASAASEDGTHRDS